MDWVGDFDDNGGPHLAHKSDGLEYFRSLDNQNGTIHRGWIRDKYDELRAVYNITDDTADKIPDVELNDEFDSTSPIVNVRGTLSYSCRYWTFLVVCATLSVGVCKCAQQLQIGVAYGYICVGPHLGLGYVHSPAECARVRNHMLITSAVWVVPSSPPNVQGIVGTLLLFWVAILEGCKFSFCPGAFMHGCLLCFASVHLWLANFGRAPRPVHFGLRTPNRYGWGP
jgi:hypothetical protein